MENPKERHVLVLGATGHVGAFVIDHLLSSAKEWQQPLTVVAATRNAQTDTARALEARGVTVVEVDMKGDAASLIPVCRGADRVFVAMPQSFTPQDMLDCQATLTEVFRMHHAMLLPPLCGARQTRPSVVVKLSSFGIDHRSAKYVQLTPCATLVSSTIQSQGPLGEAHRAGEEAMLQAGLPLVSVRPTSFFSNFTTYDLPALRASASFASPLGLGPRVNWVSCEDIGRVAAALLLREPTGPESSQTGPRYEVVDVTGPDQDGTLSAADVQALLTQAMGMPVRYDELPLPADPAYEQLWRFLRAGGFDASTDTVTQITGRAPEAFADFINKQSYE